MTLLWDANGVTVKAASSVRFTHEEVASLTNYEAKLKGLPNFMEALLLLTFEARIDSPNFRVEHVIEPFNHMHPWVRYERVGALLIVGERVMRLNMKQMRVMDALDGLRAAGGDVAARLQSWVVLMEALHSVGRQQVVILNEPPRVMLTRLARLPEDSFTREGKRLVPLAQMPKARWSMDAGKRYYISDSLRS